MLRMGGNNEWKKVKKGPQAHVTPLQDWLGKLGINAGHKKQVQVMTLKVNILQMKHPMNLISKAYERWIIGEYL